MLLNCCTQNASKFGNLTSGSRSRKGNFSFQFQRKARPKNVKTTVQLHSFHMLARLYSKPLKPGFSSIWTKNFQKPKLDLKKAEEPEIKSPTSLQHQENYRKTATPLSLTTLKPLTVSITTNCEKCFKRWKYQSTSPASWDSCVQVKKQ